MYNSRYFTCEQIDQRLLDGFYDDFVTSTSYSGSKDQFIQALSSLMNNSLTNGNIAGNLAPGNISTSKVLNTSNLKSWLNYFKVNLFDSLETITIGSTINPFTIYKIDRATVFGRTPDHYSAPISADENGYSYLVMVIPNTYLDSIGEISPIQFDTQALDTGYKVFDSFNAASSYLFYQLYNSLKSFYQYTHDELDSKFENQHDELIALEKQLEDQLDEAIKQNILYIEYNQNTGDIVGTYGVEGPVSDISRSPVTGDIVVDYNKQ